MAEFPHNFSLAGARLSDSTNDLLSGLRNGDWAYGGPPFTDSDLSWSTPGNVTLPTLDDNVSIDVTASIVSNFNSTPSYNSNGSFASGDSYDSHEPESDPAVYALDPPPMSAFDHSPLAPAAGPGPLAPIANFNAFHPQVDKRGYLSGVADSARTCGLLQTTSGKSMRWYHALVDVRLPGLDFTSVEVVDGIRNGYKALIQLVQTHQQQHGPLPDQAVKELNQLWQPVVQRNAPKKEEDPRDNPLKHLHDESVQILTRHGVRDESLLAKTTQQLTHLLSVVTFELTALDANKREHKFSLNCVVRDHRGNFVSFCLGTPEGKFLIVPHQQLNRLHMKFKIYRTSLVAKKDNSTVLMCLEMSLLDGQQQQQSLVHTDFFWPSTSGTIATAASKVLKDLGKLEASTRRTHRVDPPPKEKASKGTKTKKTNLDGPLLQPWLHQSADSQFKMEAAASSYPPSGLSLSGPAAAQSISPSTSGEEFDSQHHFSDDFVMQLAEAVHAPSYAASLDPVYTTIEADRTRGWSAADTYGVSPGVWSDLGAPLDAATIQSLIAMSPAGAALSGAAASAVQVKVEPAAAAHGHHSAMRGSKSAVPLPAAAPRSNSPLLPTTPFGQPLGVTGLSASLQQPVNTSASAVSPLGYRQDFHTASDWSSSQNVKMDAAPAISVSAAAHLLPHSTTFSLSNSTGGSLSTSGSSGLSLSGSGPGGSAGGGGGSSSDGHLKRSRVEVDDDPRCDVLNLFDAYKAKSWVTLEELRDFFLSIRNNREPAPTAFTLPQLSRINDSLAYFFHENGNNKSYCADKRISLQDLQRFCKYFCCKGPEFCLDQLLEIFEMPYFHGFLGGSEALALCQNARKLQKANGQYLLRFSMTRDFRNCGYFGFTALRSDKSGKEEEYNVLVGFDVVKNAWVINPQGSDHTSSYPTLHDIVAYNATVLRYPVERTGSKLSSISYMTRNSALDDLTAATMNMSIDSLPMPTPQLPDVPSSSSPQAVPRTPGPVPSVTLSASLSGESSSSIALAPSLSQQRGALSPRGPPQQPQQQQQSQPQRPGTPPSPPQPPMSPASSPSLDSLAPGPRSSFPPALNVHYTAKTGKETQKTFKISSTLTADEVLKQLAGAKAAQYELQDGDGCVVLGRLSEAFDGQPSPAVAYLREKEELDL